MIVHQEVILYSLYAWKPRSTGQIVDGVLTMIDLAGSERSRHATESEMEETKSINLSLLSPKEAITVLAEKQKGHVVSHKSTLIKELKTCLCKDAKILILVNVSMVPSLVDESFNSLDFAETVNVNVDRAHKVKKVGVGAPLMTPSRGPNMTKKLPTASPFTIAPQSRFRNI